MEGRPGERRGRTPRPHQPTGPWPGSTSVANRARRARLRPRAGAEGVLDLLQLSGELLGECAGDEAPEDITPPRVRWVSAGPLHGRAPLAYRTAGAGGAPPRPHVLWGRRVRSGGPLAPPPPRRAGCRGRPAPRESRAAGRRGTSAGQRGARA